MRHSLSKKVRFSVFHRDAFTCQYCGRTPPQVVLEVDHILPVAEGGGNDVCNLVTACFDCNNGKGANCLNDTPEEIAERTADRMEARRQRAEQVRAYDKFLLAEREEANQRAEDLLHHWDDSLTGTAFEVITADRSRSTSLRVFMGKMPTADILDAMDIAIARQPSTNCETEVDLWRYFCGVCWRAIKEGGTVG